MVTTQVYLIMYVLMFIAEPSMLLRKQPDHPRGYEAPGLIAWCWVGGFSRLRHSVILIGFVPPSRFGRSRAILFGLSRPRRDPP